MKSFTKSRRPRIKYKTFILIFFSIFIIFALSFFAFEITGIFNLDKQNNKNDSLLTSDINYSEPSNEQIKSSEDAKKQILENKQNNDLGISFSSISQNNNQLKIKVAISGVVSNDGTCDLVLEKNNQQIKISKPTFALTSYSTCQGFDIETSELTKGEWITKLSVTIKDKTSMISKTITLE